MDKNPQNPWLYSKAGVLIMLFLVLGPLGLPFLFKSREFSKGQKVWWTAAVLFYTALMLAIIVIMIIYLERLIRPMLNTQF